MSLELRSIIKPGDPKEERITLRATSDTDIGDYLLAQSGYTETGPTTEFFHTFWFPYKDISSGDIVVLYTRAGKISERVLDSGKTAHFYYWDLSSPIWNLKDRSAVLLDAPTWSHKKVSELISG